MATRKVFISFLGTGPANSGYDTGKYQHGNFDSDETKFIQTATLDWIKQKEEKYPDCSYIFLTKEAKKTNWNELKLEFDNKQIVYQTIEDLPKGENEREIRDIFSEIEKVIHDGDELYIDLTHGFRYMPMILLIVSHLATITKQARLKHVSYGSFLTSENHIAPIIDLLPLVKLLDNTTGIAANKAVADYLSSPEGKSKINILVCGKTSEKEEKLKKTLKTKLSGIDVDLDMTFELGYEELKNSTIISQIDNNRFDFIIAGPMPHSIRGKAIPQGLENYCKENGLKATVFIQSDSELSKTYIRQVAEIVKNILISNF